MPTYKRMTSSLCQTRTQELLESRKFGVYIKRKQFSVRSCVIYFLPCMHTGCDTNSRIFGIGKGIAFKKAKSSQVLQDDFTEFQEGTTQEQVTEAGERIIVALYGGSSFSDLNSLRLHLFTEKTINGINSVQIHTLPPTSAAAKFHSLRSSSGSRMDSDFRFGANYMGLEVGKRTSRRSRFTHKKQLL
ncbi:hypothetical protein DPMN_150261 [Dreissena polymorpha]|uniref:Uncharacterized protein n=1 Tax=Dreissena polymorpha TaxID=45954 RepID=A0A9D4FEA9_DREPO|nr:hypothetical protein DPMN_150261 [Dreissena polymorpha]